MVGHKGAFSELVLDASHIQIISAFLFFIRIKVQPFEELILSSWVLFKNGLTLPISQTFLQLRSRLHLVEGYRVDCAGLGTPSRSYSIKMALWRVRFPLGLSKVLLVVDGLVSAIKLVVLLQVHLFLRHDGR